MYEKIALISDTHLDFWAKHHSTDIDTLWNDILWKTAKYGPDLIVFAGDQGNGIEKWQKPEITKAFDTIDMISVPGNHDYYHTGSLPLEPLIVENEHVIGTTLWTRFDHHVLDPFVTYSGIADARFIKNTSAARVAQLARDSIAEIVRKKKPLVVTHFPPFQQSTSEKFRGDPYNSYFINDMDRDVFYSFGDVSSAPEVWMCGHVHHKHVYTINETLVACNPMGYPNEIYSHVKQYSPMIIVQKYGSWIVEMYQ